MARCGSCDLALFVPMTAGTLRGGVAAEAKCPACKEGLWVPQVEDYPAPLLRLCPAQVRALRPLELMQGDVLRPHRVGWQHTTKPSRLRWAESVGAKISRLPAEQQAPAQAAYDFLMKQGSKYREFVEASERSVSKSWLPLGVLLEPSLECALWPNLYPSPAFCDGWSPEDEPDDDMAEGGAWSLRKASFTRKLRSGILDYHFWPDLHVFQFDRWLFGRITGAGHSAGCSVHQAIHNMSFASAHRRRLKYILGDLHQQLGPATLFLTLAPYELSLPYAEQLQRDLRQAGLGHMRCAALEVPWAVHVSLEVLLRYLCGIGARPLSAPVLRDRCVRHGKSLVKAVVVVAEFQSGARQPRADRAQVYHGRDAVHFHTLIWLERAEAAKLEYVITADLPAAGTAARCIASAVQGSHMPAHDVREAPTRVTRWAGEVQGYEWRYSAAAAAAGIRPYILEILTALRSHMDVQVVGSTAGISAYMAKLSKYLAKDHRDEAHGCDTDPWRFAHSFLQQRRPGEAELQMLLQRLPLQRFNGRCKHLVAPTFASAADHTLLQKYLGCTHRAPFVSFKAWLRAYRTDVPRPHPYKAQKLTAVGARTVSPWNPMFLEQWLLLHVPLVSSVEEVMSEAARQLPADVQSMCCALEHAPEVWGTDEAAKTELLLHGETGANLENLVRALAARRFLVAELQAGRLYERPLSVAMAPRAAKLSSEQRQVFCRVVAELGTDPESRRCIVVTGGPGSGKTHLLLALAAQCSAQYRVAVCAFSGVQASRLRGKLGDESIPVDTVHGLFCLHADVMRSAKALLQHDLILIDEFVQLGGTLFQGCLHAWDSAGRLPLVVCFGDWLQLQGMDDAGQPVLHITQAPLWAQCYEISLHEQHRAQGGFVSLLQHLRHARPTTQTLAHWMQHRTWCRGPLTSEVLRQLFEWRPEVRILAIARRTVQQINFLALEGLFAGQRPLGHVYLECGDEVPMHRGQRMSLTRNLQKFRGHCNGLQGTILRQDGNLVTLSTEHGLVVVHPFRDADVGSAPFFPMEVGYATTLAKVQGAELPAVAICCDVLGVPAAGYVALSRVRREDDVVFLLPPRQDFFTPGQR